MHRRGVTIIEMVIVVLILIILAIIAIWSSRKPSIQAEASAVYSELKAVYTGVLKIKQEYELENFEDYTEGVHYNAKEIDSADSNKTWYIIYGIGDSRYNEKIMENLGVDELKRNYRVDFDTADVEFLDGPVKVDEYEIDSYDDIKTLMESGVI